MLLFAYPQEMVDMQVALGPLHRLKCISFKSKHLMIEHKLNL